MTLQEMLEAVDELSWDEVEKLQARIERRRKHQHHTPTADEELPRQLDEIFRDAEPVKLVPGTMDVEKLEAAMESIRNSFTKEELDEVVQAMNEEYIELEV